MLSFTTYSYPKSESVKEILLSSIAAGLSVYIFLIIFQPFGTENFHHPYKYLLLFPYCIIFGATFLVVNLSLSRYNDWNIGAELLKILVILFLGSILSYLYNTLFLSHVEPSFWNYCYMLLYSLAIGIPISTIYVLSRYIYLKRTHEHIAHNISEQLNGNATIAPNTLVKVSANNTELTISEDDFLCVQSMENYCTIYFLDNEKLKKTVLRISFSNILKQVETNAIKKCHRSYIVNLGKVKSLKGNAQGYKLILPEIDFEVPVSRSFISDIIPQLQQHKG